MGGSFFVGIVCTAVGTVGFVGCIVAVIISVKNTNAKQEQLLKKIEEEDM